ncbi:MAG TPA: hypothetical protein VJ608_13555 [Albitalea sp.]|nr:hypothetical protein [Albitalea sp.]HJW11960.1 hypothetical protein [Albitalea sp.]
MNTDLQHFLHRFVGVVAITLLPIVFTAFVSMPLSLSRHPGEVASQGVTLAQHMS